MPFPVEMKTSAPAKEITMNIDHYLGIDISRDPNQIDLYKSPEIFNMVPDNFSDLDKCFGVKELFDIYKVGESCTGMFYNAELDDDIIYFTLTDHKMYTYTISTEAVADPSFLPLFYGDKIYGFNYNDAIYVMTSGAYIRVNSSGSSVGLGTVPTITIATPMAGGGTPFEDKNLLTNRVEQLFSADGSTGTAQLLYTNIGTDTTAIEHNGVSVGAEGVNYTVNHTTGVVDFTAGSGTPYGIPTSGTSNLSIIYSWQSNTLQLVTTSYIYKCTLSDRYGGANDIRVWVSGNPDYPGRDWRSDVQNPEYFPDTGFDDIGSPGIAISGYSSVYEYQIIFKEDSIYRREYTFNSDLEAIFTVEWLSRETGCNFPDSIQVLNSKPCFLSHDGMYQIVSVDTNNENNIQAISNAVNKDNTYVGMTGLLETVKDKVISSIDYHQKYYLFTDDGEYWMYDYQYLSNGLGQWYYGEVPHGFIDLLQVDGVFYMAHSERSTLAKEKDPTDLTLYSDTYYDATVATDYAIECYWISKIFEFASFTNLKLLAKIFFTMKRAALTSANLWFRSDVNSTWSLALAVNRASASYFTYSYLVYSLFGYGGNTFPKNIKAKIKAKKIGYGQIKLGNSTLYESFGLLNTSFKYLFQREVK